MKLEAIKVGDRLYEGLRSKHGATKGKILPCGYVTVTGLRPESGYVEAKRPVSGDVVRLYRHDLGRFRRKPIPAPK